MRERALREAPLRSAEMVLAYMNALSAGDAEVEVAV